MPGQCRNGDRAEGIDSHRCSSCPHEVSGPATQGSADVIVNGKPAVRKGDGGVHSACCGGNTWTAQGSSDTVTINGKQAFRLMDATNHCGGTGMLVGEVEEQWDSFALVEYPTNAAFQAMIASEEYGRIVPHRIAGLAGQLDIRVQPLFGR